MWGSMFGKGKAYPELGGERGMGQGWYGAIGKLAIAALLIGAVLIWRAEAWLHVDVPLEHADVIVVLGGESGQRVIGAAELYHQGVAPKVFVTGSGGSAWRECRMRPVRANPAARMKTPF